MFSVVAMKSRTFFQLMSRCAGDVREQNQTDSQAGKQQYSIPWVSCSVYERGLASGGGIFLLFLISMSSNLLLSRG